MIILSDAIVDGKKWVCINTSYDMAKWIRTQYPDQWYEHSDGVHMIFDVTEELYIILKLRNSGE